MTLTSQTKILSGIMGVCIGTAAWGQDCVDVVGQGNVWDVTEMRVFAEWYSDGPGCEWSCNVEIPSEDRSVYLLGCQTVWGDGSLVQGLAAFVQWGSPKIGGPDQAYEFWINAAIMWWNLWHSFGTVSASFVPSIPMKASEPIANAWSTGGGFVANQTRYFHAGQRVDIEMPWVSGNPGIGTNGKFVMYRCADTDSNGICDEYENAARNFGDFDASGDVGAPDLALLLSSWGTVTAPVRDLDGDGVIGASDLGILLSRWGLGA
jgi:hypothetical protein